MSHFDNIQACIQSGSPSEIQKALALAKEQNFSEASIMTPWQFLRKVLDISESLPIEKQLIQITNTESIYIPTNRIYKEDQFGVDALPYLKEILLEGKKSALSSKTYPVPEELLKQLKKCKRLEFLLIQNIKVTKSIVEDICLIDNLEVLGLERCCLEELPAQIISLNKVRELYLEHNYLNNFPEELFSLKKLKVLDLFNNKIPEQDLIENLKNLSLERTYIEMGFPGYSFEISSKELLVHYDNLVKIYTLLNSQDNDNVRLAIELTKSINIKLERILKPWKLFFDLEEKAKRKAEEWFGKQGVIRQMNNQSNIGTIEKILNFPKTEKYYNSKGSISWDNRQLTEIPVSVRGGFAILAFDSINLNNNLFTNIPREILTEHGRTLRELKLNNNKISEFPPSIDLYTIFLDLGNNLITNLPDSIGDIGFLEWLDLSNNKIDSIPKGIGKLRRLKVLNLSGNKISALPESFSYLEDLRCLNLEDNPITDFTNLPSNLEYLWVSIPDKVEVMGWTFPKDIYHYERWVRYYDDYNRFKIICTGDPTTLIIEVLKSKFNANLYIHEKWKDLITLKETDEPTKCRISYDFYLKVSDITQHFHWQTCDTYPFIEGLIPYPKFITDKELKWEEIVTKVFELSRL